MTFVVAQIEKDYTFESDIDDDQAGREFHYGAMLDWWGWGDVPESPGDYFKDVHQSSFKLYDDDDELYYEGWLINDDQCLVQQFVLDWAMKFAGCTMILVKKNNEAGYIQEIG